MASDREDDNPASFLPVDDWLAVRNWLTEQNEAITEEQIALNEIPAPIGMEGERAQAVYERFLDIGLRDVEIDTVGNVLGIFSGREASGLIVLAAHLDTVFPPGTDVRVQRQSDGRLVGPGIGDNAGALAAILAVARALRHFSLTPELDVLFFAPVGEEGRGNLRGTRHLFDHYRRRDQIRAFITLDSGEPGFISYEAVGSKRFKVTFQGPGGHSFQEFGRPSALHAACRAVTYLCGTRAAEIEDGTLNVGIFGATNGQQPAGTSVNTIAQEAAFEVDLRFSAGSGLDYFDRRLHDALDRALADEKAWALEDAEKISYRVETIGERPAGKLHPDRPLVRLAIDVFAALGLDTVHRPISTDANVPLALGVPALALWRGGRSDEAHTLHEWYDPTARPTAVEALLRILHSYK